MKAGVSADDEPERESVDIDLLAKQVRLPHHTGFSVMSFTVHAAQYDNVPMQIS